MISEDEFNALKSGDRVLIEVEVKGFRGGWMVADPRGPHSCFTREEIHSVLPSKPGPIKVGDVVTWGVGMKAFRVAHIDGDGAVMRSIPDNYLLFRPTGTFRQPTPADLCWPVVEAWRKARESGE